MLPTGEPVLVTRGDAQIDIIVHNVALVSLGRNGEPVGISTRHGLRAALGLLVLVALSGVSAPRPAAAATAPNIVLILTDRKSVV